MQCQDTDCIHCRRMMHKMQALLPIYFNDFQRTLPLHKCPPLKSIIFIVVILFSSFQKEHKRRKLVLYLLSVLMQFVSQAASFFHAVE